MASTAVKRKPVYCGACSMDISAAVRIRCAQLAAVPNSSSSSSNAAPTRKYEPIDSLPAEPRRDGLVPTCDEFDICGSCFCEGKEVGRHKRWHDYRVVTQHAYPIFTDDWGADEELLLISACQTFGLGNWADIAEHIGSLRTKEEVEAHYLTTYIESSDFPLPVADTKVVDQNTFQARKKQRLEEAQQRPVPIPPPKPLASAPTCHDVAGYMPGRLEFETEWENDAEGLIKDMEFGLVHRYGGDDQPTRDEALNLNGELDERIEEDTSERDNRQPQAAAPSNRGLGGSSRGAEGQTNGHSRSPSNNQGIASANQTAEKGKDASTDEDKDDILMAKWDEGDDDLELKLTMHEIYNERIERRLDAKHLIFDRGLLDFKKMLAVDKKRGKDEKDLLGRVKVFSRLQTAADHEDFANGLLYEQILRRQISDLQDHRQAGLTSFIDIEKYEKDKKERLAARGVNNYRDAIFLSRNASFNRAPSIASSREGTPKPLSSSLNQYGHDIALTAMSGRRGPGPQLSLSTAASLQLLSHEEILFCSELRILPKPYLFIKQSFLREYARYSGQLDKARAGDLFSKVDSGIIERIWKRLFGTVKQVEEESTGDSSVADNDEGDLDSSDEDERDLAVKPHVTKLNADVQT